MRVSYSDTTNVFSLALGLVLRIFGAISRGPCPHNLGPSFHYTDPQRCPEHSHMMIRNSRIRAVTIRAMGLPMRTACPHRKLHRRIQTSRRLVHLIWRISISDMPRSRGSAGMLVWSCLDGGSRHACQGRTYSKGIEFRITLHQSSPHSANFIEQLQYAHCANPRLWACVF